MVIYGWLSYVAILDPTAMRDVTMALRALAGALVMMGIAIWMATLTPVGLFLSAVFMPPVIIYALLVLISRKPQRGGTSDQGARHAL